MIDIFTIGRETAFPSTSFLRFLRAMNNSNFNIYLFNVQSYIKLLCIKSILLFFIVSCGLKERPKKHKKDKILIENQVIDENEEEILIENLAKPKKPLPIQIGNERLHLYIDSLKNKRIAIVGNQTSMIGNTHLVDSLLSLGITIQKVFSPEHGFRGDADAGEKVKSGIDPKTGIPLISLYGNNKKPKPSQLKDVDLILFDIQDVGVRFYTYISTLHYIMEACAENHKQLIVLDRPNPNAHYVDGPVREPRHKSFIGMHPVPIVYGMTIGEYALMLNGECWLSDSNFCDLSVVSCKNYNRKIKYEIPVPPSPNLKSDISITLYPSLCFFEATTVSVGRGTDRPFEMFGHPLFPDLGYTFTPIPNVGAKNPLWENRICKGLDLSEFAKKRVYEINLTWLLDAKKYLGDTLEFINQPHFFDRLAGTSELRRQIYEGWSEKDIRHSWRPKIQEFRKIRTKYLMYD
jgi:uncharacterized protein YbbC (DUF1343 family)